MKMRVNVTQIFFILLALLIAGYYINKSDITITRVTKVAFVNTPSNLLPTDECMDLWLCYAKNFINMGKNGVEWNYQLADCVAGLFEKKCFNAAEQAWKTMQMYRLEQISRYKHIVEQLIEFRKKNPVPTGLILLFMSKERQLKYLSEREPIGEFMGLQAAARDAEEKIWTIRSDEIPYFIEGDDPRISLRMLETAYDWATLEEQNIKNRLQHQP